MAKREDQPHRLNLVIGTEVLEKVRVIAKERFNAKPHHVTGQIEITKTLLKLIDIGIETTLESDLGEDSSPEDKHPNFNSLDAELIGVKDRVKVLEEEVKQISIQVAMQIKNTDIQIPTQIEEDRTPIKDIQIPTQIPLIEDETDFKLTPEEIWINPYTLSQEELAQRYDLTKPFTGKELAQLLKVDPSCLSRHEKWDVKAFSHTGRTWDIYKGGKKGAPVYYLGRN